MTFEMALKFLEHIRTVCEEARRDAAIQDSEVQSIRNEIAHFKELLDSDPSIRDSFRQTINNLHLDLSIKPEPGLVGKLAIFLSPIWCNDVLKHQNRAFSINDLEHRVTAILDTISKQDVIW